MHSADVRALVRGNQAVPHLVVAFARRHHLARPGMWGHTALWDEVRGVFNESLLFQGVVETPQAQWLAHYAAFDLIAVPCRSPQRGIDWARGHAEARTPYDYAGAWSVPFRGDWQDEARLYCAEKEALALMRAGLQLFADPLRGIHPHDLWRVCAAFALLEFTPSPSFTQPLH